MDVGVLRPGLFSIHASPTRFSGDVYGKGQEFAQGGSVELVVGSQRYASQIYGIMEALVGLLVRASLGPLSGFFPRLNDDASSRNSGPEQGSSFRHPREPRVGPVLCSAW